MFCACNKPYETVALVLYVRVCVCVCVCVRACVRACVRVCVCGVKNGIAFCLK